jgi:hypothetical protein
MCPAFQAHQPLAVFCDEVLELCNQSSASGMCIMQLLASTCTNSSAADQQQQHHNQHRQQQVLQELT